VSGRLTEVAVNAGSCGPTRALDAVPAASGCFTLEFGPWPKPVLNADLPDTIRLDTARSYVIAQSTAWRVLLPAGRAQRAFWAPSSASAHAVRLIYEREFGIEIGATIDGSSLQGIASGSMDDSQPRR
jgi:hypothetical protein